MKTEKRYRVIKTKSGRVGQPDNKYQFEGTLPELIQSFSYTLETGAAYSHEKGNAKINRTPKTIDSLCNNLNRASDNAAANGYSGVSYEFEVIVPEPALAKPTRTASDFPVAESLASIEAIHARFNAHNG